MRPLEERWAVRRLADAGLNASQIARSTDIPRSTLRRWLDEPLPDASASCAECGHPRHDFAALPDADYAYLLGFYLGDGTIIRHRRGVFRLCIVCDSRYQAVIEECALAMAALATGRVAVRKLQYNAVHINAYSKAWPCLFPQHGAGRKHLRRIELADWQQRIVDERPQQFVRGLLHSDGCRITNWATTPYGRYEYPRYLFKQVSDDIRGLFCDALDRLAIAYTHPKNQEVSIARGDSVRLLDQFVGPKS